MLLTKPIEEFYHCDCLLYDVVSSVFVLLLSQVIDYEVPLIVLASLSLIAALVIPIIGLVFCCCRCRGKCGGIIYDDELKQHPAKERIAYSAGILLYASLLM